MDWIIILGYVASGAVFVTFWMKTHISLRLVAITGNALYLAYGISADIGNIILLHGALLPLNIVRLYQAVHQRKRLREIAEATFDAAALTPFMHERLFKAGTHLFRRGDEAAEIYFLAQGEAVVEELDIALEPGTLVGEIAIFTEAKRRTQSVRCVTDCVFMRISEEKTLEIHAENPEFGLYLTKMMVARLLSNADRELALRVA